MLQAERPKCMLIERRWRRIRSPVKTGVGITCTIPGSAHMSLSLSKSSKSKTQQTQTARPRKHFAPVERASNPCMYVHVSPYLQRQGGNDVIAFVAGPFDGLQPVRLASFSDQCELWPALSNRREESLVLQGSVVGSTIIEQRM